MTKELTDVLDALPNAYADQGFSSVVRRGVQYARERLPGELWPPICLDPKHKADSVVRVLEPSSIPVNYQGNRSETLPLQLDRYNRRIAGAEGNVYAFDDVRIVGRHPVVEVDGTYFSASWFGVDTPFFVHQRRFLRRNLPLTASFKARISDGDTADGVDLGFLLLTERGAGFHHWFYEVLPKLKWLEAYEDLTDTAPEPIVHSPLRGYQRRSLELMGYPPESYLVHGNGQTFVDRLLLAPHPIRLRGNQLQSLPTQLKWVGDRIKSNVSTTKRRFGDRIYVSRADADRRRIGNEESVFELLAEMGFERYEPGRLSLEDQVRLFAGADVIVGPHGLAYTNLIYAEDATLVELFPEGGATETYFVASEELGLSYELLECEPVNRKANVRARDKDLVVPIDELQEIVESVCGY